MILFGIIVLKSITLSFLIYMPRLDWKYIISSFFLISFVLLRIMNLHVISHLGSNIDFQHCENCVLIAQAHQTVPLNFGASSLNFSSENNLDFKNSLSTVLYTPPYKKAFLSDYFFNKPPPFSQWDRLFL